VRNGSTDGGLRHAERVESYSLTHLVPLALFVVGLGPVLLLGRRDRASAGPTPLSRGWAVLIPAIQVPFQVADVALRWDSDVTLPFHLCDLTWVVAAVALWTHRPFFVALTCFWGLLTTQALLTPSLGEDFPEPWYLSYWTLHILIVWAAAYLVLGLRLVPTWRDYAGAVGTTVVWAVFAMTFNAFAGTNYGYLMEKPGSGTILDLLGPWPWYVAAEIVLVAGVWALVTAALRRGRPAGSDLYRPRSPRSLR